MAANPISKNSIAWIGPITNAVAVTPHATDVITPTRGLVANVAGDVAAIFADATDPVTLTLNGGQVYPYSVKAVRVTGTTATGIFALY